MLLQDAILSALKIYWFSSSLSLRPLTPRLSPSLALKSVLLGWACASWSKASLLVQGRGTRLGSTGGEDEKKVLAAWHLSVAYAVVWGCKWSRNVPPGRESGRKSGGRVFAMIVVVVTVLATIVDEIAYTALTHAFLGPSVVTIRGLPPPPKTTAEDCMICLGVGLTEDDKAPTDSLQSFCKMRTHVAHVDCMMRWYRLRRFGRRCPVCRRRLEVTVVDDQMIIKELGWVRGLAKAVRGRWDWRVAIARASVTVGCVLGVVAVVLARAKWEGIKARRLKAT